MNRDYFEILTMLAGGNANRMYDLFLMYKGYTKKDYESFKKAVHSVLLYGLIENRKKTPVLSAWGEPPKGGKSPQT